MQGRCSSTAAMYVAILLAAAFGLDPLLAMLPVGLVLFVAGYLLQRVLISPACST